LDAVLGAEDAVVRLVRGDRHLVAVEGDLALAGDRRGADQRAVPAGEGVRVVGEDVDGLRASRIDRDLVQGGGDPWALRAADGELHGRRDGRVGAVADGDGHV